jgi:hypothetical protein
LNAREKTAAQNCEIAGGPPMTTCGSHLARSFLIIGAKDYTALMETRGTDERVDKANCGTSGKARRRKGELVL